jgi:hypothetical protein
MPSTAIRAFRYDRATRELRVTFVSGRIYVYAGVPPGVAAEFEAAESKGRFFNAAIRDRYPFREIHRRA